MESHLLIDVAIVDLVAAAASSLFGHVGGAVVLIALALVLRWIRMSR